MQCPKCSFREVRSYERHCPACQFDCGFPNVRAAEEPIEREGLTKRVGEAKALAEANGAGGVLAEFRRAAASSHAMRARSLDLVYGLLRSDDPLMGTFHDLTGAGLLRPL